MKNLKSFFTYALAFSSLSSFAADKGLAGLENANSLYQSGNCEKAVPAYQSIQESSLDQSQKDLVVFRTSYCQFSLGHYPESEAGFKKYLALHPNEDEAKLKYAQSLLYENKYDPAFQAASSVGSANFKTDAAIVMARAQIELGEYKKAIILLKPYFSNAEAVYWASVASYRMDEDSDAEKGFKVAAEKAPADSWIKTESTSWLNRIDQDKRRFHLRLTVGVLKDSNLDQSGGTGTMNAGAPGAGGGPGNGGGPGGPGMNRPDFSNANYTSGTGKYAAIDFIHNTYVSRKYFLTTTASFSSPFYTDHSSYNEQMASVDFTFKALPTTTFNYGASFKYLDTFYNKVYSQDYVYFTPTASWSFAQDYWLKLSTPFTAYRNNKRIKLYGGNADLYYDPTNWVSVSVGSSLTKSSAPTAVVQDFGSGPTLVSGTMFSHYTTTGAYLGLTFYIADSYQLGLTGSAYSTKYDLESIPGGIKHEPRKDNLRSYQVNFSKAFIQNVLTANLSYSYTKNKSEGFPGLISNGSVSNNSYTRNYTLLSLEYYY